MRVLYLTNNPNLGSTARVLQEWLLVAVARGDAPCVVAQAEGPLPAWLRTNNVPVLIDQMPWFERRRPWRSLWHAARVARWARRQGVDVIHCNEHNVYPFALVLRRFLDQPLVCHVRYKVEAGFARWAFRPPKRVPDFLIWTSQQQRDDSAEAMRGLVPAERQAVIPLGLDAEQFAANINTSEARQQLGIPEGAIAIGTASALRPRKRIHEFVEMFHRLAPKHPHTVAVIAGDAVAGDEAYRDEVFNQIKYGGFAERFILTGHLDDIQPFVKAIDIFVSTSEYETFGMSVCEAMACSKPVAGYTGGSIAEVVGDTGLIVETGDVDGLTEAVSRLLSSDELRAELGRQARRRVIEKFSPAASYQQLTEIYSRLCGVPAPALGEIGA